jgi:hypothetical protein
MWGQRNVFRETTFMLMVCVLLCCACSGRRTGPLLQDLLNDEPCAAPCWQGIVFGQTSEQEALRILSALTRKSHIGKPSYADWSEESTVQWMTRHTDTPREISAESALTFRKVIAHHLNLSLDAGLTAQMVIDKSGEPSIVYVYEDGHKHPPHVWATLCYPEQGMEFDVLLESGYDPTVLGRGDQVPWVFLYAPMTVESWLNEPLDPSYPWRYRPSDESRFR